MDKAGHETVRHKEHQSDWLTEPLVSQFDWFTLGTEAVLSSCGYVQEVAQ